ncbi:uncharacterized protein [Arachis hypogaea]|uniref:uncharacterized protein n=1 Tax=Arachis hypogaea TaxID=3818 RepID=UPI003B2165DA
MSSSARKEEGYDDDDACMYAMLLSTFQVFPFILNAAVELNLFQILSELATNGAYSSFTAPSTLQQAGQNASVNIKDAIVDGGIEVFKKANGMSVWEYMEKDAELVTLSTKQ